MRTSLSLSNLPTFLNRLYFFKPTFSTKTMHVVALLFIATIVAGCGKNDEKNQDAEVRVLNLAPESGSLSIVIEDETTNWQSGIGYKTTTAFKNIGSGTKRVRISNSGGVIIDQNLSMLAQKKQLMVVFGGKSSLGVGFLNNDISSSASGKSKLRLSSFAVGLGSYDLYMTTSTENYLTVEPKLRGVSNTTYEIDVGTYAIRLTSPSTKDILFELPARSFEDRKYYNLALYNEGSAELPSAFWAQQDDDAAPQLLTSTVSRIRGINSQAAFPTVNVNIGSSRVFTNIPFGGISSFTRATSGTRSVSFSETTNGTTLSTINDSFDGGRDYSVFLSPNPAGGLPLAFRTLDRNFPPSAGKARVRLVNASSVADLGLALSFSATTTTVAPRAASDYVEINAGDGTPVTITQGIAATPVLTLAGTDLSAGRTYTFVVSGTGSGLGLTVRQDN
jgi:Domain of unknown function (DUF4397)